MDRSIRTYEKGNKIGYGSTVSIGIGGMVGGAIFAVLGLSVQLAGGAVPIAFLVGGLVAFVTSYSYSKLSVAFPNEGGTVEFLNQAFGRGIFSGGLNTLLCLSYVVVLSLYAYAFGGYGASFFPAPEHEMWKHLLITGILIALTTLNFLSAEAALKSENLINALKLVILCIFIVGGFWAGIVWERMDVARWVPALEIVAGGMIIFVNYEGFELIANAARDVKNRERNLPLAYYSGVLLVIVLYCAIAVVSVGHLTPDVLESARDYALGAAARSFMGPVGFTMIAVAALLATASAINATFYCTSRITFTAAEENEMPQFLEDMVWGKPVAGLLIVSVTTLIIANFFDLRSISTMASSGFLLIFAAVNLANVRLAQETKSRKWLSALGLFMCLGAFLVICVQVFLNLATRNQLWVLAAMLVLSFGSEVLYTFSKKKCLRRQDGR